MEEDKSVLTQLEDPRKVLVIDKSLTAECLCGNDIFESGIPPERSEHRTIW